MGGSLRGRPGMIVHSEAPYNAEPPLGRLRAAFLTGAADFYVRSHGNIPEIDPAEYRLRVDGLVAEPLTLTVAALRARFQAQTVNAVLQCAGNRRADLQRVRPVSGDPWAPGAIGHAEWGGVGLAEVLRAAGAAEGRGLHVAFAAADEIEMEGEKRFRFGVSIPMEKAMAGEVLLAFEMNGAALAAEHGFPLRVVVPGFAGVRSPKWLMGITVQDRPSNNHMQQRDYKMLPPGMEAETVDWAKGATIEEMPLNSAICEPGEGAELAAGRVVVRGYAIASARGVVRVDVSGDGGRNWVQAALEVGASRWSWVFWEAAVELSRGEQDIIVRAWDSAGQTQPSQAADVWNTKGYLSAAWHRVRVRVV